MSADASFKSPDAATYEYNAVDRRNPWSPSFLGRAPYLGLGAMIGALLAMVAAAVILFVSDDQPTSRWKIQPTVYLAIASAAIAVFTTFALTEAATIAWWSRAMRENTTIADLQRTWEFGHSLWAALASGRYFNLVALASILVALVPINGPLLQRASLVRQGHFDQNTEVSVKIAQALPDGYTGFLSSRGRQPTLLAPAFVQVVLDHNQKAPIPVADTGCTGTCDTEITGVGFIANCTGSESPYRLNGESLSKDASKEENEKLRQDMANGTDIFGSVFEWGSPGVFNMGAQFKNNKACDGVLAIRNCTFTPAVVRYPVTISGKSSRISLRSKTSIYDDKLVKNIVLPPEEATSGASTSFNVSTYGGMFKYLGDSFDSLLHMNFGAIGYQIYNEGALSNRYLDPTQNLESLTCSMVFSDPTNDILASVRELMFRTALASVKGSQAVRVQKISAKESLDVPVYESSYTYLAIALVFSLLGWTAIVPVFLGWKHLGRPVSMSPIETAKAFGAPVLKVTDSNADTNRILQDVGDRGVKYGAVTTATDANGYRYELKDRAYLGMAEPSIVRHPRAGERFNS